MGYRYEYEYLGPGGVDIVLAAAHLEDLDELEEEEDGIWKCTIYDEDTDEELATGDGYGKTLAREDAESNL